jgi:3-oxoacyl-[acyl-carrier protein] reductase
MAEPYVWITGASSGIGFALTEVLLHNGYNVFGTARREVHPYTGAKKGKFLAYQADIANTAEIKSALEYLRTNDGFVQTLVNNAGITSFTPAEKDSIQLITGIINTNLLGAIIAIKSVLPDMIEKHGGSIINILSTVTHKVYTYSSAYSASKSGLLAYTDVLREEVRKENIKVINVVPGPTATPIWSEQVLKGSSKKMMKAEDVANIILQLLQNDSTSVPEEIRLKQISGDL